MRQTREALLACVVLESFPEVAKVMVPLSLDLSTGSSGMTRERHSAAALGFAGIPHWTWGVGTATVGTDHGGQFPPPGTLTHGWFPIACDSP
jgi:hypothetical protein